MTRPFEIKVATAETYPALVEPLAVILKACVDGGAGVHFLAPIALERAVQFWHDTGPAIRSGDRRLFYAIASGDGADGRVLGTVQLVLGQTENGWHRAEISKMLVAPEARRLGVARALLERAEADARAEKRELLFLDTVSDSPAEHLYASVGYRRSGIVPIFAKYADGSTGPTSIMYKRLDRPAIAIRRSSPDAPEAVPLIDALSQTLEAAYGSSGRDGFAPDAASAPRSAFLIATVGAQPSGCVALRPLDGDIGEIKRMYAAPETSGVGSALLGAIEIEARRLGYRELWLETRIANRRAVSFYCGHGYLPRENYGKYVGRTHSICLEKRI